MKRQQPLVHQFVPHHLHLFNYQHQHLQAQAQVSRQGFHKQTRTICQLQDAIQQYQVNLYQMDQHQIINPMVQLRHVPYQHQQLNTKLKT